jgi:hypothetical protein
MYRFCLKIYERWKPLPMSGCKAAPPKITHAKHIVRQLMLDLQLSSGQVRPGHHTLDVHRNGLAGAGGEPLRNGPGRRRRTAHRLKASGSKEVVIFIQMFIDEFEVGEAGIIPGRHQQRVIRAFKHVDAVDSIEGLDAWTKYLYRHQTLNVGFS